MPRYKQIHDGDWVQPVRRDYRMSCCDCGLVHRLDFRLVDGRIQFRAARHRRATAQIRRRMKRHGGLPASKI